MTTSSVMFSAGCSRGTGRRRDRLLVTKSADSSDSDSPCEIIRRHSRGKIHRLHARCLHSLINTLENRCKPRRRRQSLVSVRHATVHDWRRRTPRGLRHWGLRTRATNVGMTFSAVQRMGNARRSQSVINRVTIVNWEFRLHQLLRILPDLRRVRAKRKPQSDQIRLKIE